MEDASLCAVPALCWNKLVHPFVNLRIGQEDKIHDETHKTKRSSLSKQQLA